MYSQREGSFQGSDPYRSVTTESSIEPIHTKEHYGLYGSDMAFPGDVLPEFSFDSVSARILGIGFMVFLVVAFWAVHP